MKIIKHLIKYLILSFATLALVACTAPTYVHANKAIKHTQKNIHKIEAKNNQTAPPVLVNKGYYVNVNPVHQKTVPKWMQQPISLQADKVPFDIMMNRLLRSTNINVSYDDTIREQLPVSMHYTGTMRGALNVIADKTDYYYHLNGQTLNWSGFETRTFNISFMPGSSSYLVGQTENEDRNNQQNGGGFSGEHYGNSLDDEQYSNLEGQLSVWNDLRDTLNRLKSPRGEVVVSESTSSVTVHDHPRNVRAMATYIKKFNKTLSKEVAIKVQVLDIELNRDFNFGIDWNAVITALDTKFRIVSNWASTTNLAVNDIDRGSGNSAVTSLIIGKGTNSSFFDALSKQGKLRVVTKPEVVTMNDQVATIRITRDTSFVKSISTTTSGFNLTSTSIIPGTITDGFTLYVLPKIVNGRVYMQISSTLSNLEKLEKTNIKNGSSTNGGRGQLDAIELPTITEKSFNQRSVVTSGATLVIAGYKSLNSETANAGLPGINKLGLGARQKNVETLVLITPIILKTHSGN